DAGFLLLVVTNQPDVARGRLSREAVDSQNAALGQRRPIAAMYVGPHDDADGCECRKPLPGLLITAAREWNVDLPGSFMVGDRWKDVAAGAAAGVTTVFIENEHSDRRDAVADAAFTNLADAARWILDSNGTATHSEEAVPDVAKLRIKLFADGADPKAIAELARDPHIRGFTT